ncbi:hypothetical protein JCM31271_01280 [Halorubrum trueperi]
MILSLLGAIVLAVAPDFTADGVRYLHEEPAEAFLSGLVAFVVTAVAMLLLAVTVVGLVIVIPLMIVFAILGIGATTVSIIALGSWLRSVFDGGATTGYGFSLVIGAIVWAVAEVVPILGGLVTFVVGTMGFGYLMLWVTSHWLGRDYGSFDDGGTGTTDAPRDRNRSTRDRTDGNSDSATEGVDDWDDPDRFRNIAAVDAEREEREATETNDPNEANEPNDPNEMGENATDHDESSR